MGDGVLRWGPCAFHGHCRSADGTPSVVRKKGFVFGIQSSHSPSGKFCDLLFSAVEALHV